MRGFFKLRPRIFPNFCNTEHYHCGIAYVTSDQAHRGLRDSIVAKRKGKLLKQRMLRKEVNQSQINNLQKWGETEIISLTNRPQLCSVIQTRLVSLIKKRTAFYMEAKYVTYEIFSDLNSCIWCL